MNTIVCLEPGLSGCGEGLSKRDTGFGNRVLDWAILYYISTLLEDCELLVQEEYWPELEFISLPKTKVTKISSDEVKEKFLKLSPSDIAHILNYKDVSYIQNSNIGWYFEGFETPPSNVGVILSTSIKDMKFKDEKVNEFFKDRFSDFSSIHLRRGFGTTPSVGFVEWYFSYNKEILKRYLFDYYLYPGYADNNFLIIPDVVYFSIIEDIILKNKDHKIYISSDISENFYSYYFEKYPDNIVNNSQYIDEFLNLFEYDETKVKTYKYSLKRTLINLFDMFVLAHSKTLIIDGVSSWGHVAFLIGKKNIKINPIQYILDKEGISYHQFVKKYKFRISTTLEKKAVSFDAAAADERDVRISVSVRRQFGSEGAGGLYDLTDSELSLLELVDNWYFPDNSEEDYINLMNQIDCWLSLQKKSQVDDEYSLGWNECIENIKTKLM
jgi:hypothetical protein